MPRFQPENFAKNLDLVRIFETLAQKKGCSSAQVVLAWIMFQGKDFFPIPGTRTSKYLEQNLASVNVTITTEENEHIRESIDEVGGASGSRTVDMANSFADTPAL